MPPSPEFELACEKKASCCSFCIGHALSFFFMRGKKTENVRLKQREINTLFLFNERSRDLQVTNQDVRGI